MKPIAFQRIDDGELFTLNDDGRYSIEADKRQFPGHRIGAWTEEVLAVDKDGCFRAVFDETELAQLLEERFK